MTTTTLDPRIHTGHGEHPLRTTAATGEAMWPIQATARIAGALWLLIAVLAGFVHFYVPGQLLVPGDATATATRIMASPGLLRTSIAAELVLLLSELVVALLIYFLLRPVGRTLSLVAAVSRLAMIAIHGFNVVNLATVLLLLSGAGYLAVFESHQLHALAMLFLDTYSAGFSFGMAFFALHFFPLGYLIYRSGYFPRILGVLFLVAGVAYVIDTFSFVLVAGYKTGAVYFALPIAVAESAFPLWLLTKGVRATQWDRLAGVNARRDAAARDSFGACPTSVGSADLTLAAAVGGAR